MIIKATKIKSIRHAGMLGKHLLRADENEIVEVQDIRGMARPDDLMASLRSMQRATELTKGKTGLFHTAISPRSHEADKMTPEQWERAIKAIENEFGLGDQPRALVVHRKDNRTHIHAVWQLTDTELGKLIDIKHDYRRCVNLGLTLEKELGHDLTNREPSRNGYTRDEQQRAKRRGEKVPEHRAELRADFARAKNVAELEQILGAKGYMFAKGDKADIVLVDRRGDVFGATRELGVRLKEIKQYLGDRLERLPTVEQARQQHQKDREKPVQEKTIEQPQKRSQTAPGRQKKPQVPYEQNIKVTFNTQEFKEAQAAQRLNPQNAKEQAEREKQERIAQRMQEWEEQQNQQKQRNRTKGLDLDR